MRIPVPIPGHAHSPEDGIDTRTSVRCGDAIEAESDVLSDRQMGKESVVLTDETDPPPFRRQVARRVCDDPPADADSTPLQRFQPGCDAQDCRIAAAGGSQKAYHPPRPHRPHKP